MDTMKYFEFEFLVIASVLGFTICTNCTTSDGLQACEKWIKLMRSFWTFLLLEQLVTSFEHIRWNNDMMKWNFVLVIIFSCNVCIQILLKYFSLKKINNTANGIHECMPFFNLNRVVIMCYINSSDIIFIIYKSIFVNSNESLKQY